MRSFPLAMLVCVAACSDELPAMELLDDHATAMAVSGNELYWVAERDGALELDGHSPEGPRTLWTTPVVARGQPWVGAGPEGVVVADRPFDRPACNRYFWIHRDGTSEDVTTAALCDVSPLAVIDGGLLFMVDDSDVMFRFDLTSGAVTSWYDVAGTSVLYPTADESYVLRAAATSFDLVRVERSGDARTLATIERADRFALAPDAIYWTRPGWEARPTTVTRVPRDGSGPPVDVLATRGVIEGGSPPYLEQLAWVEESGLWVSDGGALYRVDDGELVMVTSAYHRPWQLAAYNGALVMLTEGGVDEFHMRLQLQRLH